MVAPNQTPVKLTREQALVLLRGRVNGIRAYCTIVEQMADDSENMSDEQLNKVVNSTRPTCQGVRKSLDMLPMDEKTRAAYEVMKIIVDQMRKVFGT